MNCIVAVNEAKLITFIPNSKTSKLQCFRKNWLWGKNHAFQEKPQAFGLKTQQNVWTNYTQ